MPALVSQDAQYAIRARVGKFGPSGKPGGQVTAVRDTGGASGKLSAGSHILIFVKDNSASRAAFRQAHRLWKIAKKRCALQHHCFRLPSYVKCVAFTMYTNT